MHPRLKPLPRIAGTIGLSLALSLSGSMAFADDDDDPTAYLYEGTCANLENATVVDEIDDLDDDDRDEVWEWIGQDQDMPDGLLVTDDDIDDLDSVQALVDGEFSVVVHETEETSSAVLVCGDVIGDVQDDSLLVQLDEIDGSGWEGRVFIHPDLDDDDDDDDNDDELEFEIGIYPAGSVEPLPSPTPAG